MSTESIDMTESITPRSDQQNFDDYLTGPRTVTVDKVTRGSAEQPVDIHLVEYPGKAYRPSKSMRRVLVFAWGKDASAYVGRRLRLYGDPEVKFGGQKVGGIKISHLSHIDQSLTIPLTETRGTRRNHRVDVLPDEPASATAPKQPTAAGVIRGFTEFKVTAEQLEAKIGRPHADWTAEDIATLAGLGKAIKAGETTPFEEFEQDAEPAQGELGDGAE